MKVGGLSEEKPANQEVQALIDHLANQIKSKTGKNYSHLRAISYKSQIVAGINYFVKVDAGDENLHVRVFQPLPCYGNTPELHGIQVSKGKNDLIEYFEHN